MCIRDSYEALFTPWKIGNVEIKNRIVLCPMGGTSLFGWMEPVSYTHLDVYKRQPRWAARLPPDGAGGALSH